MRVEPGGPEPPPIHWHETIDSTNAEAHRLAEAGAPHGTAVAARYQTAGRGQFGRTWIMAPGEGVLASVVLRRPPRAVPFERMTIHVAEALAGALERAAGVTIAIKPPNDLTIDGRKLGGILCEARWRGEKMLHCVVGVGINVNVREFPHDLKGAACSLLQATGREFDVEALTATLIGVLREL